MTEKDYDIALSKVLTALAGIISTDGRLQLLEFNPNKIEHKLLWKLAYLLKFINPKITIELEMGFFSFLWFSKKRDWVKRVKRGSRLHNTTCYKLLRKVRQESNYPYTIWEDIYESFYRD